jgi:hypothetical protein
VNSGTAFKGKLLCHSFKCNLTHSSSLGDTTPSFAEPTPHTKKVSFLDKIKLGPDLFYVMVLLISHPQALLAVRDCFFLLKDQASINAVEHIAAGTTIIALKYLRSGALTVERQK